MAQMAGAPPDENECKFFKVEIGQSAEIKPNEELKVEDLQGFHYFLKGDAGLRDDFRIPKDIMESCAAAIPAFQQAASQAAVGGAAAAAAAGVAPATLAAGSIAGSLGLATLGGLAVFGLGIGVVAATNAGGTTGTVSTVEIPSIGPE